jgi:capsular polysaccharide biosynthesis protein
MVPNPAYQTLNSQLQQLTTDIQIREERKKGIEDEMALINKRVARTPEIAQKLAEPIRINEALVRQYDKLKADLDAARMSESAENSEKGAQLTNISPATYPFEPAPPSRTVIFLVGLLLSLGLGISVAFAVDIASPVVFTQSELERVLQVKVLVEIPRITTPSDIRKGRIMAAVYGLCFLVLTGAYGVALFYLYTKQGRLVQLLDPVIQRLQG